MGGDLGTDLKRNPSVKESFASPENFENASRKQLGPGQVKIARFYHAAVTKTRKN